MRSFQLAHDDLYRWPQRAHGVRDTAREAAAAERHEDRVDVGQVLENLQRERAVPGERSGIAYGVDVHAADRGWSPDVIAFHHCEKG